MNGAGVDDTSRPERPSPRRKRRPDHAALSLSAGRILIAEDEPLIASFLEKGLRASGYTTTVTENGQTALELADSEDFDLMILDVGLPGLDGFSVVRELRSRARSLPVIILTARNGIEDTVAGLEGGADDYIVKPFHFDELLARIRARLRETVSPEPAILTVGNASLDLRTRELAVGKRTVELTARECALAEVFFRHPGEVLDRDQLIAHVWGEGFDPGSNVVEVYVRYLRQKLGPEFITTVRSVGYKLEPTSEPARRR
jgi:two-component system, OmpR family, copper resistance phosphate regulon response regulator CusR